MLQLWTQVTQCPNEACTRKHSQRLQYCTSSTFNWNECFCLGHWQLTCSTSHTIYHISPDENHFKHRDLQRISKQPQQTQQHYLSMKTNQATLTDLHHHGHCAQQPLLCLSATPLSQDLGGLIPIPETILAHKVKCQIAKQGRSSSQVSTAQFFRSSLS